jgi:hypothetical protein
MPITIENWQRDPSIAAIVKATFPTYRRKKVLIWHTGSVTLTDLNWSGGTRKEYRACSISRDGTYVGSLDHFNARPPWDNKAEGKKIDIPQGIIVVEGGYFCGNESILYLHVNPQDLPKYIEAEKKLNPTPVTPQVY